MTKTAKSKVKTTKSKVNVSKSIRKTNNKRSALNKRAKTNAIVNNIGINKANSLWLISESSLCYDFSSEFTDDDHYIDGMELIKVPPVITTECIPF